MSKAMDGWSGDPLFEMSGFVAGDLRLFPHHAIQPGQDNQRLNSSLVLQPEFLWEWNGGDDRIEFAPFARLTATIANAATAISASLAICTLTTAGT